VNPLNIKGGPAVWVGILAAVVLAVVKTLAGEGVLGQDVVDTIGKLIDPTGGVLIPIILGFITRFFVSPAERVGWK